MNKKIHKWPNNQSPFKKVDVHELLDKISDFYKLDLSKESIQDIWKYQSKILEYTAFQSIYHDKLLFRAYKTEHPITEESWLWIPPNQKPSRISSKERNVLYTSSSVPGAIIEAEIDEKEEFNLITYELKEECKLEGNMILSLDGEMKDKFGGTDYSVLKIIQNFVDNEFLKHIVEANSFLYKSTQSIIWNLFDTWGDVDAFFYPSVANYRRCYNVAVKSYDESNENDLGVSKLKVKNVQRAIRKVAPEGQIVVFPYMQSNNIVDGKIVYDKIYRKPEI